jgi:hypothetical protein
LIFALPARFAKRPREAEAGGRHGEANRFAALGDLLEDVDVFKPKDTTGPRAPMQAKAEPPHAPATGGLLIAAPPASLPDDAGGGRHAAIDNVPEAAMISPPSRDASLGRPPATWAGRASDGPPDAVPIGATPAGTGYGQTLDPTAARQQGAPPIVPLLAKLDKQIAADPATSAQSGDTAAETVADLLTLLPNAPPSDAKLVLALPAHCAKRAREAAAGGRFDEANRFVALGGALEDLLSRMAPKNGAAGQVPQRPKAEPPATASGSPAIAAAPVLPPGDPASRNDALVGDPLVGVHVAMTSPPNPEASPIQPQAALAGRAGDRSGVAIEPKPASAKPSVGSSPGWPVLPLPSKAPARSGGRKPPQTPELRVALRDMPSTPAGTEISPERAVSPRAVGKVATAPAAPAAVRRLATANAVDRQCRAIVLKFEIGEEPSDAERTYLRHGCRQHG